MWLLITNFKDRKNLVSLAEGKQNDSIQEVDDSRIYDCSFTDLMYIRSTGVKTVVYILFMIFYFAFLYDP